MADADLTIVILREIQTDLRDVKTRVGSLEEKADVTNQRLSLLEGRVDLTNQRLGIVESTLADAARQIRVATAHLGQGRRETSEIDDLKQRVSRLEDIVKP